MEWAGRGAKGEVRRWHRCLWEAPPAPGTGQIRPHLGDPEKLMCLLQGRRKLRPVLCPCLEKTTEAELLTGTSAQVSWFPDNPGDVLPPLGNRSKPTCVSGSSVSADKSERCDGEPQGYDSGLASISDFIAALGKKLVSQSRWRIKTWLRHVYTVLRNVVFTQFWGVLLPC